MGKWWGNIRILQENDDKIIGKSGKTKLENDKNITRKLKENDEQIVRKL